MPETIYPKHLPYTVENNRPTRLVRVHGKQLAPRSLGGASTMHLTEEQFLDETVQELLRIGRLICIRKPEAQPEVAVPVEDPPPTPPEGSTVEVPPGGEIPPNEPAAPVEPPSTEKSEDLKELEPLTPAVAGEAKQLLTISDLQDLDYRDLQALAREMGLTAGGKVEEIIKRILEAQGGTDGA